MEKNLRKITALVSALLVCLSLCACGSDYPVTDRTLDLTEFLNFCFEGSGYELELDGACVTVSAVADRMSIDMEKSQETAEHVQAAVRSAVMTGSGICGTWRAAVDIGPLICRSFEDIEGLSLESYISGVIVHAEICFTESGIYILSFDEKELDNVSPSVLTAAAKAVKNYLGEQSGGAAKLMIKTIDDKSIRDILGYVMNTVTDMLKNGKAGNYTVRGDTIIFADNGVCRYKLSGENLTISGGNTDGLLSLFCGSGYVFSRV